MSNTKLTPHKIKKAIPLDQECFATHDGPSEGIGLRMYVTEDNYTVGLCETKKCHQGYENTIHGGIISTYFDEVLWYATTISEKELVTMTVEMTVRYLKPLLTGQTIRIVAEPMVIDGRHVYVDGYILNETDQKVAEAKAHFIAVKSDHELNDTDIYGSMQTATEDIPDTVIF